jgi:putative DNA methylase
MSYRKKLIEVALPLDAVNTESAREKSIRHGHPSTLHLWWSRKPLATCRAVLFASLVDDPSEHPEQFPTEEEQDRERERLFGMMRAMVKWENANNEDVMKSVRAEIRKATGDNPPSVLDPFAGGGSIPLEAQRLGLEAHASDLNPVAVLLEKALIEIPPKFADRPPVNPDTRETLLGGDWHGARGLATDIRYYGKWMRDEAQRRIGHLYPPVTLSKEHGGEATVIAWLWVRTVSCPNPACGADMPLTSKWWLSKKKGKETWVEPSVDHASVPPTISYTVALGKGGPQDGTVTRQGGRCIACGVPVAFDHIRAEGKAGRMGAQLMAIVAEGQRGRVYLAPTKGQVATAESAKPEWKPEQALQGKCRVNVPLYGMNTFGDLFTPRQLVALTTFSDLVQEARERVLADARAASLPNDDRSLNDGGMGAGAYADAVATYLGIVIDKGADYWSSICSWHTTGEKVSHTFTRQAIPMVWDFTEANPFSTSSGNLQGAINWTEEVISSLLPGASGEVQQRDATSAINGMMHPLISTDPPYYDNIGYADLADFFYVWLRRSLGTLYPDLFRTLLVPKSAELVATPYRFEGSKSKAQQFFEEGLGNAFAQMRTAQHPDYPLTVYYAFKQAESEEEQGSRTALDELYAVTNGNGKNGTKGAVASTGWETMLEGLIRAGFTITGTWPVRTEMLNRSVGLGTNALASSIVLVCRPRPVDAPIVSRREFLKALRAELPDALRMLQHGSVAPVDLAQASIGPGMRVYSRYSKVVESDGSPLRVRTALQLINTTLDEVLAEQEGEYDAETRWAVAWFEQYALNAGEYGTAETLSKAKNISLHTLVETGWLEARAGKVRLLKREELPVLAHVNDLKTKRHLTVWEVTQRMTYALDQQGGESGAGDILRATGARGEIARDLAYRLYTLCERKGWTQEAQVYNNLVTSWPEISRLARREPEIGNSVTLL